MPCKIFRDTEGNIETVYAPNGQESKLYADLLAMPDVQGDKELAAELYLVAYTPSFKSYFGDFENGEIKGVVDKNDEPLAMAIMNFLMPKEEAPLQRAAISPRDLEPEIIKELEDYYNSGFKERPDHKSWYVKDHLDVVKRIVDDLHSKYGGSKYILDLMVYTHDLAKAMNNERLSHRETITPVLKELGVPDDIIDTVVYNVEMMDRVKKEDVKSVPTEVKILSTADALSHYTTGNRGFLNIFSTETSEEDMETIKESNEKKLAKDKRKILLPEFNLNDTKISYTGRKTSVSGSVTNYLNGLFKSTIEFQKEAPTEVPAMEEMTSVVKVLDRLKEKFGIDYEVVNQPEVDWKGKFENGKVYINAAKQITKDTAFHEYLHPFVSVLRMENPSLHEKLIKELQSLEEGRLEIESVRQSEGYSNLTEEEILDEALVSYLGKLASGNITEKGDVEARTEVVRQSMLSRFTNWLKKLFSGLFSVKMKDFSLNYTLQDVANFVSVSTTKVDVSALPVSFTPQYQLDEPTKSFKNKVIAKANDLQKKIIDDLIYEPKANQPDAGKVILEEENHVYIHTKTGQTFKSVTTAIKGKLDDPEGLYELNRLFGNQFDKTLQNIILGKSFDESKDIMTGIISEEISKRAYDALQGLVIGLTADGSIILPQIVLADSQSGIAGSLDLFVVKPDGSVRIIDLKVSKNSHLSSYYRTKKFPTSEESVFKEDLTTQQQHGIQVAAYQRLAEVNGYQVDGIQTLHILLDVEGKGKEQVVKNFKWEGIQDHYPQANAPYVDKFIPTKGDRNKVNGFKKELGLHNPANDPDFLDEEEEQVEKDLPQDTIDQLTYTVNFYVDKLRQRAEYLKNLNKTRFSVFSEVSREKSIDRISELLTSIETTYYGRPSDAFRVLLEYTKETLDNVYNFITNPENVSTDAYVDVVLEAEKFVESYRDIASIPELGVGSPGQYKLMREVQSRLNAVKSEINPALTAYVKDLIKNKSNATLTDQEIEEMLKEGFDISLDQLALSDMQNTKERLLAIAANLYTEANQKSLNRTDEFRKRIVDIGNRLSRALGVTKIDFSFMLNFDSEGKFTGRYLEAIGEKYYSLRRKMFNLLKDDNGDNMQYKLIRNLQDAKPEDIAYNIELHKKKQKVKEFTEAEKINDNNQIVSGEYHRYSEEFLRERAKYEEPHGPSFSRGILRWVKKPTISDEAYRRFRDKYYDRVEYIGTESEKGVFKGKTTEAVGYFPKRKYVETKEITSSGEDMRDPRYVQLMNDTTEAGLAKKEFYLFFTSEMKETLSKLPIDVQQKMLGKVARVQDNYLNQAKKRGPSFFKGIVKGVRDFFDFSPKMHSMQRITDDDGVPVDNLPILYTNDARNEKRIETLKEKIKELKDRYIISKSISTEQYESELKKLELSLAIENSKIDFNEINLDLVENMIAFRGMAEKYEQMSDIESSLLALSKMVEKKKYYQSNTVEEVFTRKGKDQKPIYKAEGDSLAYKRFKKWFKMVYYNNDEYDYSVFANVASKLQNITSLKGIGFNIFGGLNNFVMGRINNAIEAYGGVYYDRKAYFRATGEFNKDFMPGKLRTLGSKNGDIYKMDKFGSKYEAVVDYFRMVRKYQQDAGKVDLLSIAYIFQEAGEYNVQSKTGIAVIMSDKFQLTNSETGEKLSIYDALDFDSETGELGFKPGFSMTEEDKIKITNYIYEVNKQIHGNYAWEDRMVIQSHALGQLAAQFHKWVYPLFRSRFQKRYDNEVLGTIEGRYRTFWNVMKHVYQTEQGVMGKLTGILKATFAPGSVEGLDETQVRNMYKNIAEMSFFLASFLMAQLFTLLSSGLDDDDEEVKKLLNFMIYQQTRQMNEIKTFIPVVGIKEQYQMAKNPIAALSTLRDYGEVASSVLTMPFPPYDKNYYERGPYKGDLKAWKELKDVIPGMNMLNRWESFETVKSFYIR